MICQRLADQLFASAFGFGNSLRSWQDFVREFFCFGSEAVNASGEARRGLVKSRVEFPSAQI